MSLSETAFLALHQHVLSFSLKSGAPCAKMTKRGDLGLKTLKVSKKWCVLCEKDKTCSSRAENADLYKLVQFAENR